MVMLCNAPLLTVAFVLLFALSTDVNGIDEVLLGLEAVDTKFRMDIFRSDVRRGLPTSVRVGNKSASSYYSLFLLSVQGQTALAAY